MWSTEQNPINVFLVYERKMVPQHKLCIRMVLTPKVRFDSHETARLATTTRTLPIPESGPNISNQTLLVFRKTVHNCLILGLLGDPIPSHGYRRSTVDRVVHVG